MKLSTKEHDVLTLIAKGFSDKEVGVLLKISNRTVQTHIAAILIKLNARNRVDAAIKYIRIHPTWEV